MAWIESRYGVEGSCTSVREQLRPRTFSPVAVRQVMIPKASGKLRALGIPTVTDRVVQAALKIVLEPIFEADFQSVSYGFRPNRRAQDAIAEIHHFTTKSYEWVLEADIEACFDNIDHAALMDRVRARVADKRVLALVKSFLKAGVMTTTGTREATPSPAPRRAGSSPRCWPTSHCPCWTITSSRQWDRTWPTRISGRNAASHGLANYRLVRYADDFVVLVTGQREHAEDLRAEVATVLAPMGLRLSPEKTRVVHIDEGSTSSASTSARMRKRGSHKRFVYTLPSKKAIASIKGRVRTMTYRSTLHHEPGYLMEYLGRVLRGWANYFRHGVSKRPSTRSTPTPGSGSRHGCGRNTGSDGQSCGAGSACPGPGGWPTTGSVPWRRHRHGHPVPLPRLPDPDPVDTDSHHRLNNKPHVESPVR